MKRKFLQKTASTEDGVPSSVGSDTDKATLTEEAEALREKRDDTKMPRETGWKLKPRDFGPLWPYVQNDDITDIDWGGGQLWIKEVNKVRKKINLPEITEEFMEDFALAVARNESLNFNPISNVVCSDTDTLRITCTHNAFSTSGLSVCIRKSLPELRFTPRQALDNKYCEEETMHFLVNCVLAGINFVFCGEPGKGKTESAKFFSSFIRPMDKVITIEGVREWHYKEINPGKDCIEFKIRTQEDYEKALRTALRLNPAWIMFAEVRSREVRYLIECWSNGIPNMTTLHTRDARRIDDRILNMSDSRQDADRIVNQVYDDVGLGILLEEEEIGKGRTRHVISQVCYYYREDRQNRQALIVEQGRLHPERIPDVLKERLDKKLKVKDIFFNANLDKRIKEKAASNAGMEGKYGEEREESVFSA